MQFSGLQLQNPAYQISFLICEIQFIRHRIPFLDHHSLTGVYPSFIVFARWMQNTIFVLPFITLIHLVCLLEKHKRNEVDEASIALFMTSFIFCSSASALEVHRIPSGSLSSGHSPDQADLRSFSEVALRQALAPVPGPHHHTHHQREAKGECHPCP